MLVQGLNVLDAPELWFLSVADIKRTTAMVLTGQKKIWISNIQRF